MIYYKALFVLSIFILLNLSSCSMPPQDMSIITGAEQTELYLSKLENKRVAIVANHTTLIKGKHLVDLLLSLDVDIKKIFSPEHGFRGKADAGEHVTNYIDKKTGLPVISLYGSNKKPKLSDLNNIDVLIFDLQDVGVRYYTYISTMHYVMEACAQAGVDIIILDRPNPNGFYVDGPVLNLKFKSFVGMHPVPIVHGMTIGEYAQMINGEKWLTNKITCKLDIIPCKNYTHKSRYTLPVNPSPNLQNMRSIYLYPSLGFFEGTSLSVGRGTMFPFQVFGAPNFNQGEFVFMPKSIEGASKYPKHQNKQCFGVDLRKIDVDDLKNTTQIQLKWILLGYQQSGDKNQFFKKFFYNISGVEDLKKQIINNKSEKEIRETWQTELNAFKKIRKKYLLYSDFE
ncbi:MAG: DUF1343 domain-containing protein [Bacteroidales bacterium]|nr:DUF1343 domain-containing protein [Bacteroidales bacterium]